jgi:hypothetical protein
MLETINYVISCVKYDDSEKLIELVGQHRWLGNGQFEPQKTMVRRSIVITNIDVGLVSYTVYQNDGKWHLGGKLVKFMLNEKEFIRTDGNKIEADSLGDLPEC